MRLRQLRVGYYMFDCEGHFSAPTIRALQLPGRLLDQLLDRLLDDSALAIQSLPSRWLDHVTARLRAGRYTPGDLRKQTIRLADNALNLACRASSWSALS